MYKPKTRKEALEHLTESAYDYYLTTGARTSTTIEQLEQVYASCETASKKKSIDKIMGVADLIDAHIVMKLMCGESKMTPELEKEYHEVIDKWAESR